MKNMTTKRRKQSNYALLKTFLIAGSMLATFVGGELLANQSEIAEPTPIVVVQADSAETTRPDSPVPQLNIPKPIARSKSSK
jgi:hypothetical protein